MKSTFLISLTVFFCGTLFLCTAGSSADLPPEAIPHLPPDPEAVLDCGIQKLSAHASLNGLRISSTAAGEHGSFRLTATEIRRSEPFPVPFARAAPDWGPTLLAESGTVTRESGTIKYSRPGLVEEYSVTAEGLRQDFVVAGPPPAHGDSHGLLMVSLSLCGATASAAGTGDGLTLTFDGSGRTLAYSRLCVTDATGRRLHAALTIKSPTAMAVMVDDRAAQYPVRIDPTFSDADWIPMNPTYPGVNGTIFAMASDSSGNIYVGGDFTIAGGVPANRIARWNGTAWSALGAGSAGTVRAIAVIGTEVYAGGRFSVAGGAAVAELAQWNGGCDRQIMFIELLG